MQGVEHVVHDGKLFAIIVRSVVKGDEKYNFLTGPEGSLQLGVNSYAGGELIKPHHHPPRSLEVKSVQEFILINSGRVRLNLFDPQSHAPLSSHELATKDMVLLVSGAHGFEVLEECQIVEVKQGPYDGKSKDKVVFGS